MPLLDALEVPIGLVVVRHVERDVEEVEQPADAKAAKADGMQIRVGVAAEEERSVEALGGAVLADRLRRGQDVRLVEGA